MKLIFSNCCWLFALASLILADISLFSGLAVSQEIQNEAKIQADLTLGEESPILSSTTINGAPAILIKGGAVRGKNLFQSFREFNVEGKGVYFNSQPGIERILARITGNSRSEILGTLGVYQGDGVDLILINPNGITFGPNAFLNLTGSFLATTASSITFPDAEFSAVETPSAVELSMNIPIGLKFRDVPSSIINQAKGFDPKIQDFIGLKVSAGRNITFIGGNIIFEGGFLTASGGRIELAGLKYGEVKLDFSSLSGNYDGINSFENVEFHDGSGIVTDGDGRGSVYVQGKDITFSDGSAISALNLGSGPPGEIKVKAAGSVLLEGISPYNGFPSFLLASPVRSGNGGDISISANRVALRDKAIIQASSSALVLKSGEIVPSTGESGNITITTRVLEVDDGAAILATTTGNPNGGNVGIYATDAIILRNGSNILSTSFGDGKGGNINITTGVLVGLGNSDISANAKTSSGGKVEISAKGIFGFVSLTSEEIRQLLGTSDLSQFDPSQLQSSDITAISQASPALDGKVTLNTPNVDPSKGLADLPKTVVDPSSLVAQTPCNRGSSSQLTRSGRGGLPASVSQDFNNDATQVSLVQPTKSFDSTQAKAIGRASGFSALASTPATPAQGWVYNERGEVVLVGFDPKIPKSERLAASQAGCPVF